jgi:hypothetical protein
MGNFQKEVNEEKRCPFGKPVFVGLIGTALATKEQISEAVTTSGAVKFYVAVEEIDWAYSEGLKTFYETKVRSRDR